MSKTGATKRGNSAVRGEVGREVLHAARGAEPVGDLELQARGEVGRVRWRESPPRAPGARRGAWTLLMRDPLGRVRPKPASVIDVSRSATGVRWIVACANDGGGVGGSIRNAGLGGSGVHGAPVCRGRHWVRSRRTGGTRSRRSAGCRPRSAGRRIPAPTPARTARRWLRRRRSGSRRRGPTGCPRRSASPSRSGTRRLLRRRARRARRRAFRRSGFQPFGSPPTIVVSPMFHTWSSSANPKSK